jgi:hypothetical protein
MIRSFVRANREWSARCRQRHPRFFDYPSYQQELQTRIDRALTEGATSVLEPGGIDRPLLERSESFRYDGLDLDEQPTCHEVYDHFWVQSVEQPIPGRYDLIISMTLLEHVPDNAAAARSIADALLPGGSTHHYVPGGYHPYALATRLVGPRLQRRLIRLLRPQVEEHTSGYATFFDHCTPAAMSRLFRDAGLVDIDCKAFYRANDYFAWLLPAFLFVTAFENLCRWLDWRVFASGFVISARRPADGPE